MFINQNLNFLSTCMNTPACNNVNLFHLHEWYEATKFYLILLQHCLTICIFQIDVP